MEWLIVGLVALLFVCAYQVIVSWLERDDFEPLAEQRPGPEHDAQLLSWGPRIDWPLEKEEL